MKITYKDVYYCKMSYTQDDPFDGLPFHYIQSIYKSCLDEIVMMGYPVISGSRNIFTKDEAETIKLRLELYFQKDIKNSKTNLMSFVLIPMLNKFYFLKTTNTKPLFTFNKTKLNKFLDFWEKFKSSDGSSYVKSEFIDILDEMTDFRVSPTKFCKEVATYWKFNQTIDLLEKLEIGRFPVESIMWLNVLRDASSHAIMLYHIHTKISDIDEIHDLMKRTKDLFTSIEIKKRKAKFLSQAISTWESDKMEYKRYLKNLYKSVYESLMDERNSKRISEKFLIALQETFQGFKTLLSDGMFQECERYLVMIKLVA